MGSRTRRATNPSGLTSGPNVLYLFTYGIYAPNLEQSLGFVVTGAATETNLRLQQ
jgi:hypothetical protein